MNPRPKFLHTIFTIIKTCIAFKNSELVLFSVRPFYAFFNALPPKCRHKLAFPIEVVKRVFCHCVFEVVRGKVSVNHRHFYICVAQNIAQYQYVSAVHHKVAGEGMAQHVGTLAFW